jgi:hypothetical protein
MLPNRQIKKALTKSTSRNEAAIRPPRSSKTGINDIKNMTISFEMPFPTRKLDMVSAILHL